MGFFKKTAAAVTVDERALAAARLSELAVQVGEDYCSARECQEETGVACSYRDLNKRACPTAWCPKHRVIFAGAIYCPSHGVLVDQGVGVRPYAHNLVPSLVNWTARELHDDVTDTVERVARALGDRVLIEPVRYIIVGLARVRTWERSWKAVSGHGVDFRIAIAVEEINPDWVLAKLNSAVVARVAPPWTEEYPVGREPKSSVMARAEQSEFRMALANSLITATDEWAAGQKRLAGTQLWANLRAT